MKFEYRPTLCADCKYLSYCGNDIWRCLKNKRRCEDLYHVRRCGDFKRKSM